MGVEAGKASLTVEGKSKTSQPLVSTDTEKTRAKRNSFFIGPDKRSGWSPLYVQLFLVYAGHEVSRYVLIKDELFPE